MKQITINTGNFKYIEYLDSSDINGSMAHVTIAKDRDDNEGILLFIPNCRPKKLIWSLV